MKEKTMGSIFYSSISIVGNVNDFVPLVKNYVVNICFQNSLL